MTLSPTKLHFLKNRVLSLLQTPKSTPQILQIQTQLIKSNLFSEQFIASRLLDSLTSTISGMGYAEPVFTQIDQPGTFIWNTMIKGHLSWSNPQKSLHFYIQMRRNGTLGDTYTYPLVLKACGTMCGLSEGREVHGVVVKGGFVCDVFVRNGLIGMYCRHGEMNWAMDLFDGFSRKDLVSWNLMLGGYVGWGDTREAQKLFDEMPERDVISWSIMIDGYGKKNGDIIRARLIFDSMPIKDLVSWNSVIAAYTKVGEMMEARLLFDKMEEKNVISWSIMIDGYAQHGNPKEALDLFSQMLCQGVKPDNVCIICALSACAQLGAIDQGRWIHMYMRKNRMMMDIVVQSTLVDMYMKCGNIYEACTMFNSMSQRNVISWNVMIAGLGMNGFEKEALECFAQMQMAGAEMDDLIFVSVLTACSHGGFVAEGLNIFQTMIDSGIEPKLEHYGCLIDLLGRAGKLYQAQVIVESMPMKPNPSLWGSLLLACRTHRNVTLAEVIVDRLVELKADDSGVYVLLSNIYADAGIWEGVSRTRNLMRKRTMQKETGRSVIQIHGGVEEFTSGGRAHSEGVEIERVLWSLMKLAIPKD